MKVRYRDKEFEFKESMSVNKLLKKLSLRKSEIVVIKNDTIVTEDEMLRPGDDVRIIDTVSGG